MRRESKFKISRLAKYAILAYIIISLFYTIRHYYSSHHDYSVRTSDISSDYRKDQINQRMDSLPLAANTNNNKQKDNIASSNNHREIPLIVEKNPLKENHYGQENQRPQVPTRLKEVAVETTSEENIKAQENNQVTWPGSKGNNEIHRISEQLMKSKIFSSSMGLDNVTPYYFKAKSEMKALDITLATLVTRNRFHVLSRLATNYKGPISAAIHVLDDEEREETISELNKIYSSNPAMQQYVDVHLIVDKFDRQFNMWRNTAKLFTRTDYLMMLDVDFHLCTDFRKSIFGNPEISKMLQSGKTAIVVPAFEYLDQKDGMDWRTFPTKKEGVIEQVQKLKLDSFHSSWVSGHGATNYSRWYTSDEIYPVTEYEFSYEPYVIYKKEGTPWCDERFIGYGANKAACLYEIFISGVDYWVLPNDFLIHQSHKYANHDRTRERVHNKILYENFRTEVCLRYSRKYVTENVWYTPAADNMKKVCKDIPKWKYLSGIPKAQRLADLAAEQAEVAAAAAAAVEKASNEQPQSDFTDDKATDIDLSEFADVEREEAQGSKSKQQDVDSTEEEEVNDFFNNDDEEFENSSNQQQEEEEDEEEEDGSSGSTEQDLEEEEEGEENEENDEEEQMPEEEEE